MAALPILYSFRRCPYAMRARLALAVSAQAVEHREVELKAKPAALLQASPKGTVPVLVLPNGTVLEQSLDIMLWALRQHDPELWLPASPTLMEQALGWIAECDGPFKQQLDRYKYPHRFGLTDGLAHRALGAGFLQALNERLAHTNDAGHSGCWDGARVGLADMAIAPFVRQFAHTDAPWFAAQAWPALQHWLAAFEACPRYQQVMEKHPAWQDAPSALEKT